MTTTVRWKTDRDAVVEVSGDLDDQAAPRLGVVLDGVYLWQPASLAADLGAVTFFGSAAVGELLATRSRYSCEMAIVRAPARVRRVLAVLGLDLNVQALDD